MEGRRRVGHGCGQLRDREEGHSQEDGRGTSRQDRAEVQGEGQESAGNGNQHLAGGGKAAKEWIGSSEHREDVRMARRRQEHVHGV